MTVPNPLLFDAPPHWLPGGHLQTLVPAWWGRRSPPDVPWQRERWDTPDGDFVDVDWLVHREEPAQSSPLVILFHGLEGSSESHYAKALASVLHAHHWGLGVVHFRGCSGELNRAPRAYHSGDVEEVQWMLERVRRRHPGRQVVAVGVSLGGNVLMRWAGLRGLGAAQWVDAAVAVSAPLDLTACGEALGRGFNRRVYTPLFLHTMLPKARAKWAQHPGLFDLHRLSRCRTLYEFDDAFTAPVHGFGTAQRYWCEASAKPVLGAIGIQTLMVNAVNDPFVPSHCLPRPHEVSRCVTLWQPRRGGHVGFPVAGARGMSASLTGALPRAVVAWVAQALGVGTDIT
ncbi:YheT family hydrolase [Hydrogenophaga soli]